jgi:hypothetical protein
MFIPSNQDAAASTASDTNSTADSTPSPTAAREQIRHLLLGTCGARHYPATAQARVCGGE